MADTRKTSTRKTSTTKKTSSTSKRRTGKKSKSRAKKGKVYIPAWKIIILCCAIITLCMGLLLFTTVKSQSPEPVITEKTEKQTQAKKLQKSEENQSNAKQDTAQSKSAPQSKEAAKSKEKTKSNATAPQEPTQSKKKTQSSESAKQAPSQSNKSSQSTEQKQPVPQQQNQSSQSKATPQSTEQSQSKETPQSIATAPQQVSPQSKSPSSTFNFPAAKNSAQLVFVFDDGGQNLAQLAPFLKLPFPVTIAVLPRLAHSKESANQIRAAGKELMLHQPMQAVNPSVNPGPGAITPQMDEDEIINTLFQNLTEIGPVAGFNNHEGSAITADAGKMAVIMRVASQEGIYFLDSRTNVETKVPYVAGELGYSYYERNIFLDNEKTRENVLAELNKGLALANKNGSVIMIGHVWSGDFLASLLQEAYPELKEKGYTFSLVSKSKARKE